MSINYTDLSDADLLRRITARDSRALEALYNRYSPLLYTLVKKIVGDQAAAEQVLVDVFVIIWQKIKAFDERTNNAYCWLVTLARNKAVDTARRMKGASAEKYEYSSDYENYFILPRLSPDIDELDLKTAMSIKGNIEETLHKLTDAQQYVIYLAFYEGLTQNEIAAKLNIPVQTVKSKIKIALVNLKEYLLRGGE